MIKPLNIDSITPHPKNPRQALGDLTELADSIRASGVIQNLTVVQKIYEETVSAPGGRTAVERVGGYMVIIGHRRLAAAKLAGLSEVPCAVVDMDEQTQLATMLLENMQRADLTPYEQARGIQLMLDMGETVATIAGKTGFSQTTVRNRKKLADLDREKVVAAEGRGATLADFLELDKIEDRELKNKVLESIGTMNFNRELQKAMEQEERAEMLAEILCDLDAAGITRVENKDEYRTVNTVYTDLSWSLKDFKMPEDVGETAYFYCVKGDYVYILTEKAADEDGYAEDTAVDEVARREEERKARTKALESLCRSFYGLRLKFAQDITVGGIAKDTIERAAVRLLMDGGRFIVEDVFADFYGHKGGFKPVYNAKEDDTRQTFKESKARRMDDNSAAKALFDGVYLAMERGRSAGWHNYQGAHTGNSDLDGLYEFLCALGYQMSDEERAMQDGTHHAYGGEAAGSKA